MKARAIVTSLFCFLLCTACATRHAGLPDGREYRSGDVAAETINDRQPGPGKETTIIGAAIAAAVDGVVDTGIGKMMDDQEQDLRQALADTKAAAINRRGNLLEVTMKGDLTFDTNSAVVKAGLQSEIKRIADILSRYQRTVVRVEGHTDSTGSASYNKNLSEQRAGAIKKLFVKGGIHPGRIEIKGHGETRPIATNETESGRMQNRRVEVKVAPAQY